MTEMLTIILKQFPLVESMLPFFDTIYGLHCLSNASKFCSSSDDMLSGGDQNIYEQNSSTSSAVRMNLCYEHTRIAICEALSDI